MYTSELCVKYKYWTKKDEAINYRFIVYTDWDAIEPKGYTRISKTQAEKLCSLERKARIKARLAKVIRPVESDSYIWPYPLPDKYRLSPAGYMQIVGRSDDYGF